MNAPPTFPTIPPMPAVARILSRFQRDQLASFIEVAIGLLDIAEPDLDLEDNSDDELTGDEQDAAWTEYHTRGRHKLASGMSEPFAEHEDDEEDDNDSCLAGDDRATGIFADDRDGLPGDPGDAEEGWDREEDYSDQEREQMLDDVPMLPVVTLDTNIFTDQRQPLGIGNLQSSFQVRSEGVRSADTGAMHRSTGASWPTLPGVPV